MLDLAADLKACAVRLRARYAGPQSVAMIFDKPTLRTQVSFAAGIAELGGNPMLVDGKLAGIGVRESVEDVGAGARPPGLDASCGAPSRSPTSSRWRSTPASRSSTR